MKAPVYIFKQAILGVAYLDHIDYYSDYFGRSVSSDANYCTIIKTSIEDMTPFERLILDEYEENIDNGNTYSPTVTGSLA